MVVCNSALHSYIVSVWLQTTLRIKYNSLQGERVAESTVDMA